MIFRNAKNTMAQIIIYNVNGFSRMNLSYIKFLNKFLVIHHRL